jgi:hypothetical protein
MMSSLRTLSSLLALLALGGVLGCETESPTKVVVENGYPVRTAVYRAWWVTTYFPDPVAPGQTSTEQRGVPGADTAYAVLAPGWDPSSAAPPTSFVVSKSKAALTSTRGDTLHIVVSDSTFEGSCAAKQPLSQADADFITQRIFPAEFAGVTYDAASCVIRPVADAGAP